MENVKDILDVIDLDALNTYNAERVEEGDPPISIREAYEKVEDLIEEQAVDLCENILEKTLGHFDRFVNYNYRCYEGNHLEYADNAALVNVIAERSKQKLF